MSRNRSSSQCDCCWRFDEERELPADTEGLLTFEQYFAKVGFASSGSGTVGYGYRDDLHGSQWLGYERANGCRGSTNGRQPSGTTLYYRSTSVAVPQEQRYRVRYLECPLCLARYAGWYRAIVPSRIERWDNGVATVETEPVRYELYDTSFWSSFNDEPGDDDRPRREVTWDVIRRALLAWFERGGS